MAPKAQKRSLSTTRPRRSAAHIAQERSKSGARRPSSPRQSGGKAAGRATRVRQREANPKVRKGRFFLLIAFMGALGFTTVYLGDTALRAFAHLDSSGKGASLWHKVVDRLLDRDIPGLQPSEPAAKPQAPTRRAVAPKARTPTAGRAGPASTKPLAPAAAPLEKLPKVAVPETPRAELAAPPPSAYAEASGPSNPRRGQDAAAAREQRMRALLDKVGVDR